MNDDEIAAAFDQLDQSGLSSVLRGIDECSLDAGVLIRIPIDRQPYVQVRFNLRHEINNRVVDLFRDGFGEQMSQTYVHLLAVGIEHTQRSRGMAFDPIIEKIAAEQNAAQMQALNDAIDGYGDQYEHYEGEPREIAKGGLERLHEQCVRKGLPKHAKRIEKMLGE